LLLESLERRDAPGAMLPISWETILDVLSVKPDQLSNRTVSNKQKRLDLTAENLNDKSQRTSKPAIVNTVDSSVKMAAPYGSDRTLQHENLRSLREPRVHAGPTQLFHFQHGRAEDGIASPSDSKQVFDDPSLLDANCIFGSPANTRDASLGDPLSLKGIGDSGSGGGSGGGEVHQQSNPTSLNGQPMGSTGLPSESLHTMGGGLSDQTDLQRVWIGYEKSTSASSEATQQSMASPSTAPTQDSSNPRPSEVQSVPSIPNGHTPITAASAIDSRGFSLDRIGLHRTAGTLAPTIHLVSPLPSQGQSRIYLKGALGNAIYRNGNGNSTLAIKPQIEILVANPNSIRESSQARSLGILQSSDVRGDSNQFSGTVAGELAPGSLLYARLVGTHTFDHVSAPFVYSTSLDTDSDGVHDPLESSSQRSDINKDGILDQYQSSVASFPESRFGEWLSLSASVGEFRNIRTFQSQIPSEQQKLPYGLIGFDVDNVPIGGMSIVRLQLPADSFTNQYWKVDTLSNQLVDFSFNGSTGAKWESGAFLLYLQDGGRGDADGIANGRIVDPGGPGTSPFRMFSIPQSSWTFQETGGTQGNAGTFTNQQMIEGDSLLSSLSTSWTVPATANALLFDVRIKFDRDSSQINDALEVGFVDTLGNPLVPTFAANRDSFLNVTEGQSPSFGTTTSLNTTTIGQEVLYQVALDLTSVPAGTSGTLFVRLINNDNASNQDNSTAVRLYFENNSPVANPDSYSTLEDTPLTIPGPGVLGNDSDPESDSLMAVLVRQPTNGSVVLNSEGGFTYNPSPNFSGFDSFTYRANDGFLNSSEATVVISVVAVNDPPVAIDDNYSARFNQTLSIAAATGLLRNDHDIDSTSLTTTQVIGVDQGPNHGSILLQADGSFSYSPNAGFSGNDYFTYRTFDGIAFSRPVRANIRIAPTVTGVFVDSTQWSNNFAFATLGYPLVGNTRNLPWFNLNQVRIQFSEPIQSVSSSEIVIHGSPNRNIDYNTGLVISRPDSRTLELTLRTGLVFTTDKIQVSVLDSVRDLQEVLIDGNADGLPGDPFNLSFAVVRGDVNNSNSVLSSDVTLVSRSQSGIGTYNPFMDVNGSATILSNDVTLVTRNQSGLATADTSITSLLPPSIITNPTSLSKFFVPDSADRVAYRYSSDGTSRRFLPTTASMNVRGSAMTSSGDRLWLVNATDEVQVFEPATGTLLGNWRANGGGTSEGITVWGTDTWIVSPSTDRVYRFQEGARTLSGTLDASFSFPLDSANSQPTGIVTNGLQFWVTDSLSDRMFVYGMNGDPLGSWPLDPANTNATGVTLNPAGGTDLWTVDKDTRRVYTYAGGLEWLSSNQSKPALSSFSLNSHNTDPEDIADPPPLVDPMRWIGTTGGNWNSPSNWNLNRVPTANDDVVIDIPNGDYNVDINGQANVRSLHAMDPIRVLSGGTLDIGSTTELSGLNLESGGVVEGFGNIVVTNEFLWRGGALRGNGIFELAATASGSIAGNSIKNLNRHWINKGRVTMTSQLALGPNASFQNNSSGEFRIENDVDMVFGDFNRALLPRPFTNSGILRKPNGTDESTLHLAISNTTSGVVIVDSGILRVNAGVSNAGSVSIGSSAELTTFSTQTSPSIASIGFQQSAGVTTLSNGTLSTPASLANSLRITGGILSGSGNLLGNVLNAGELQIGNPVGALNVTGSYAQSSSGLLSMDWLSDQPILGNDQLRVTGTVSINGNIAINRTGVPAAANEVVFIDNDGIEGIAGTFANLPNNTLVSLNGRDYKVNYAGNGSNSNDLSLTLDAPMLSIRSVRQPESQTNFQFTVSLSRPSADTVTVEYFTSNDSATDPLDYLSQTGTLEFLPGQVSQTINIDVVNDSMVEPTERFLVNLRRPTFAGIDQPSAKGTILDEDSGPITRDNLGTEFWLTFPTNLGDAGSSAGPQSLSLFITSPHNTNGNVSIPGLGFNQPFSVQSNTTTTVSIPNGADPRGTNGRIQDLGIRIVSDREVAVYGLNQISQTTDAYTAIPVDILDTEYIVLGWKNTSNNAFARTQINVVATENNTSVSITPAASTLGRPAGVPYTINLNAGQTYQLQANGIPLDLSGTIVSSNEPIAVFGGHSCANIPTDIPLCDHVVEQIPPTSTWGTNFFTVPLATRAVGDTFRVLASQDQTSISINGVVVDIIDKGQIFEQLLSQPSRIKTNRPVLVAQYANGQGFDNANADPFMMLIPPSEQFLAEYTVSTPAANFAINYMNVVIPTVAVGALKMDGSPIAGNLFAPIPNSRYSGAQIPVLVGSHNFTSDVPFGIYSYGFNVYDSYGYPGGMALADIADARTLELTPGRYESQPGIQHELTAWALDQNGSRLTGVRIDFEVSGTHSKLGYAFTDSAGIATFRYAGTLLGTDLITASIGDLTQTAKMKWISPPPTISIKSPDNPSVHPANVPLLIYGNAVAAIPAAQIVSVTIDGIPVGTLDSAGNFFARVVPKPGQTTFQFTAIDSYGATASTSVTLRGLDSSKPSDMFESLSELPNLRLSHGITSWNEKKSILYSEVEVSNLGAYPAKAPIVIGLTNLSDPRVVPIDIDGYTPQGIPYYDLSRFVSSNSLAPNQKSDRAIVAFYNPAKLPFTFDTVLMAQLNRAPHFTSTPITSVASGNPYQFEILATDPDADPLSYKLPIGPSGMTIDNGYLRWSPTQHDIGNHDIVISATDGLGATARLSFVLSVVAPTGNRSPVFNSVPVVVARVGEDYEYTFSATDADGDSISFSSEGSLPNGASIIVDNSTLGDATAKLIWKPIASNAGANLITLVALDGKPHSRALQSFQLQVLPELGNRAPEFTSTPITQTLPELPYKYTAVAIDPDRDPLVFQLISPPNGMTVQASTGQVSWNPTAAQIGAHSVSIEVSDGKGWRTTQSFSLQVLNSAPGTLAGSVFFDVDGDGVRNSNEPPQTNWTVYLDANQNNRLDASEKSTLSNSNGDYRLTNITPGSYSLAIVMQSGWAPTLPVSQRYQGSILANQTINNLIFGNTTRGSNNNPPDFTSSPIASAIQGKRYRYTPTAIDADGDSLTFSLDFAPTGMVIDPNSGTLSWFVDTTISESRVTIRVDDGQGGSDLQSFTLTIQPNQSPEFTSEPELKATVGSPYSYNARAFDQDDPSDSLRFKLDTESLGRGMTLNTSTGLIHWSNPVLGLYPIAITVTDPYGAESIQRYEIAVNASNVNRPPLILSNPSGQIERGKTFVHSINAFDPDNDPIGFGIIGPPTGMILDASGTLRWTPSLAQLGTAVFTLAASDGSLVHTRNVTITVANHPSNDAPQFTSQPPTGGLVEKSYFYDANAFDPEGDTLRFELLSSPEGMTIDARSGIVDWKPNANQAGFHPIRLRVSDMRGGSATQSATIDVGLVNRPPVISSSPVTSSPINKPYHYPVRVSDADGDAVRFRLGNQTTAVGIDLEIDSNTGLLSWTPKSLGTYTLEVIATDAHGLQAIQIYEMTVVDSNANQPPQITSTPLLTVEVGVQYTYDLHAVDPDSSLLTYRLITPASIPPNASFDPATGLLLWTPTADQLHQSIPHAIQVSDGQWTATQSFEIKVVPANSPPILLPLADVTVVRGDKVLVDASASDADNDLIRFSLDAESIAAGLSIDADRGRIAWQTFAQSTGSNPVTPLGSRTVTVSATDGRQSVSHSFILTTVADTAVPTVRLGATDASGKQVVAPRVDQEILLFVSASDNVRVESRTLTLASVTRNGITTPRNEVLTLDANHSARLRIQPDMIGLLRFQGTAIDPSGNIGTATPLQLLVPDPDDLKPPVAQILGGPQLTLSKPTDIFVNVSDESPLVTWQLELMNNTTRRLSLLASGNGNLANAPIANLDTTMMRNGAYTLVLTAIDSGANKTIDAASVQIEGGLKLGNFSLGFNDLTVPVAGVPIKLTRRYDSLDADVSGDFGYGWSLDIATTKIELQIDPNRLPDLSGYIPFRDGDRVLVTLPDGTQEGFTFYGKPGTSFLGIVLDYVPAFVADVGVKSKLLVDSLPLKKVGDDYLDYASGRLYNPADHTFGGSYELKMRNGSSLVINAKTGELTTLVDRVGNEVFIGPDGFQSASGRGISFERDWANRITAVIDPRGKRIEYGYDGAGDLVAITNRLGATTRFTYADNRPHFLQSIVDPLGRTAAATTYAPDGRFHSLANASGQSATATYNVSAGTQSVTDANGFVSSQTMNARGNVTRTVDQTGVIATATFDSKGNVLSQTQVIGLEDATSNETDDLTTTYVYDSEFNLIETRDSFGNASRSTHDEYGAVTSSTDSNGNTSRTHYNLDGTLAFTTDPDGNTSRFRANDTGNITQSRDRNNNLLFDAVYNSFGELTSMTPGEGLAQTITYDDNGNSIASWSFEGSGLNQVQALRLSRYNDDNKVVASQSGRLPAGHHILANFETVQIPSEYLINSGQTEFDAIGQPQVAINDTGLRNETVRDIDGRIVETRTQQRASGSGNTATWFLSRTVYDAVGRTIAVTDSHPLGIDPALIEATRTEYDPAGRVTAAYRVVGIQIELVGPLHSQQSRIVSPGTVIPNSRTSNVYDSSGRSYLSIDGFGRESQSTFNAKGQTVESRTQATTETRQSVWLVSRTVFDAQGRPLVTTDQYIDTGLSMDSPPVEAARTIYDSRGRSIGTQRLTGVIVRLTGKETSVVSFGTLVSSTRTEYDSQGRAFRQIASDGQVSETEYDSRGRVAATLGMHVLATSVGLMARGDHLHVRLRSETRYNHSGQAFQSVTGIVEYGSVVNGVFVKSASAADTDRSQQRITESIYDDAGRVIRKNLPDGTFTRTEYDSKGRVVAEIDPIGNRKDMLYDLDNRLTGVMLPAVPDPRNNNAMTRPTYRYEYNQFGQKSKLTDANGHVTQFGFDATGRPTSRTLPDGQIETMAYDLQKRLVLQVSFEGVHERTVYDDSPAGVGRAARREYFANANDYNAFMSSGNLDVTIQWKRVSMTFDAFGRVTSTTHTYASGATAGVPIAVLQDIWTTTYDVQGRVIQEISPTGIIHYDYDVLGRKTHVRTIVPTVSGVASESVYAYDSLGRLASVSTTQRDGLPVDIDPTLAGNQPETTIHHYDVLGRMDFTELPNSVVQDYTFDNMDRLDVMRHFQSDANNANLADNVLRDMFDYSYRADGKRTGLFESFGGSGIGFQPVNPTLTTNYTWTYDNAGRLVSEVLDSSDNSLDQTESYIMDLAGNRMRRMLDKPNATNDVTDIYTFDSSDRILREERYAGLSPTGVPEGSSMGSTAYQWNGTQQASKQVSGIGVSPVVSQNMSYGLTGQLEKVVTTTSISGNVTARTQVEYRYDKHDTRFIATDYVFDPQTSNVQLQASTEYLIDHNNFTGYAQTILETVKNAAGQPTKRTTYTFGQDELTQTVSDIDPNLQVITQSSTLTFGHDGHGSTRVLFDAVAAIAQVFTYSAYGELLAIHNSTGLNITSQAFPLTALLYNGESIDSRTGLYNFRARWYSASNGRFERLDPYAGNPNDPFSFNKYGFVHGDPILNKDPSGKYLIAIDGTGTEAWLENPRNPRKLANGRWLSHVRNFYNEYQAPETEKHYDFGPRNGTTASDLPQIEDEAFNALEDFFKKNPSRINEPIDIIGWSRGAYSAMRLAEKLKNGLTFRALPATLNVRFLGLYDPVDMTLFDPSGAWGTHDFISSNVQNVVWAHGVEDSTGSMRDYDEESFFYYNWPRIQTRWGGTTRMTNLALEATHGAIGGTPGYSPSEPTNYNYSHDIQMSVKTDTTMRTIASGLGVPISVISSPSYGFPSTQSQLPAIRTRTWFGFLTENMVLTGGFGFGLGF